MTWNDSLHVNSPIETAILCVLIALVVCFRPSASKIENSSPSSIVVNSAFLIQSAEAKLCVAPESINVLASQFPHLTVTSTINRSWRRWPLSCSPLKLGGSLQRTFRFCSSPTCPASVVPATLFGVYAQNISWMSNDTASPRAKARKTSRNKTNRIVFGSRSDIWRTDLLSVFLRSGAQGWRENDFVLV